MKINNKMVVTLENDTHTLGDSSKLSSMESVFYFAAKQCVAQEYDEVEWTEKDVASARKFLNSVINKMRHESIMEHYTFTFRIQNISRVTSHQLVRHRIASYSQKSGRYVKVDCETPIDELFYIPDLDNPANELIYTSHYKNSVDLYNMLLKQGVKPEDARYLLPAGLYTTLLMTMNCRSLRNFLKERCHYALAQQEFRFLAE